MKCKAKVTARAFYWRDRQTTDEPTCQRNARTDGYCYQHSEIQSCSHPGCARRATTRENGRLLCRSHAPLWRAHNRIVQRILRIPPR